MTPGFPITPHLTAGLARQDLSLIVLRIDDERDVMLTAESAELLVTAIQALLRIQKTLSLLERFGLPA